MPQRYQSLCHVEIHDVWPSHQAASQAWIAACLESGWKPVLLVVPRRGGSLVSSGEGLPEDFCKWLSGHSVAGLPLWLHGLTHVDAKGGDAEFRTLEGDAMRRRLDLGRRDWNSAGLPGFEGFCAPCWKSSCVLPRMAALEGIYHTASRWGLRDVKGFHLCVAVSSWGPGWLGLLWDTTLEAQAWLLQRLEIPWRLVLHPQDLEGRAAPAFRRILKRVARTQSSSASSASVPSAAASVFADPRARPRG
ncbi:MAG: hypothetical protein RL318_1828 [Fibrobacterota bacterium]